QLVLAQRVLDLVEAGRLRAGAEPDADPLGLLQAFGGNDLDRDARRLVGAALLAGGVFHRSLRLWCGRRRRDQAGWPPSAPPASVADAATGGNRRCRCASRRSPTSPTVAPTPKSFRRTVRRPS